jgi:RNA polymerase sigma factor (sigma-70 family)
MNMRRLPKDFAQLITHELYARLLARLTGLLRNPDEARDVAHEVLTKQLSAESALRSAEDPLAFLLVCAWNVVTDRSRRRKLITVQSLDEERSAYTDEGNTAEEQEILSDLPILISRLPTPQMRLVICLVIEQKSFAQIASELNLLESTVRTYYKKGIALIQAGLRGIQGIQGAHHS